MVAAPGRDAVDARREEEEGRFAWAPCQRVIMQHVGCISGGKARTPISLGPCLLLGPTLASLENLFFFFFFFFSFLLLLFLGEREKKRNHETNSFPHPLPYASIPPLVVGASSSLPFPAFVFFYFLSLLPSTRTTTRISRGEREREKPPL